MVFTKEQHHEYYLKRKNAKLSIVPEPIVLCSVIVEPVEIKIKQKYIRKKCEHNRQKSRCRDCGGSSICEHNKRKSTCRDCGGSQICEHNKHKRYCRDCGGSQICEHDKEKQHCKICSPLLYIINLQRSNIWRVMKLTNLEKIKPTIEYLGCSAEYFKSYIQSKMTIEMTFDNIHYDHIKPVSRFNLEDENELLDCCHYTNFQPLLAVDNLSKSNKWTDENELFWKENICGKEYLQIFQ